MNTSFRKIIEIGALMGGIAGGSYGLWFSTTYQRIGWSEKILLIPATTIFGAGMGFIWPVSAPTTYYFMKDLPKISSEENV